MFVSSENISHLFLVGKEGEGRARLVGFGIFHMSPQICFLPNQEENWCGRKFSSQLRPILKVLQNCSKIEQALTERDELDKGKID